MIPFKSPLLLTVPPTLEKRLEALAALRTLQAQDEELVRQRRVEIAAVRRDIDELQRDFLAFRHHFEIECSELRRFLKYRPDQHPVPAVAKKRMSAGALSAYQKAAADDPEHPGWPAGTADGKGGQFRPKDSDSGGASSDARVVSDATPDDTSKPGAQYAANDVEIDIPANDKLTPEQLCRQAYALGLAKLRMTPGLTQDEILDIRFQLTTARDLCLNVATGVRPPSRIGDSFWFWGAGVVLFKPGETPRFVYVPTTARAMNETQQLCPGPKPDGETVVPENPAFVSACMSLASSDAASVGLRLGKSLLTHSDIWGFIWRVDFQTKDFEQDNKFVIRFVCWSAEDNNAVMGTATYPAMGLEPF